MLETTASSAPRSIPGALNLTLLLSSGTLAAACLWWASHAHEWWSVVLAAIIFSFVNNTIFALLHEAVHGVFHASSQINRWGGRFAAAFFPTGFLVQRAFHLTHHRNNRSRFEQFDYLHDDDVKWLKIAQWYAILTGVYWVVTVLGVGAFLAIPRALRTRLLRNRDSQVAIQTSSGPYLEALDALPAVPARLELIGTALFQLVLLLALDLSWTGWLACYAAFGLNWSSLQYADHAFSPLDNQNGAWNLRVNRVVQWLFLNYHCHLAHHQHPKAAWIHLPALVDHHQPRPRFVAVWWSMWRGPRPFPGSRVETADSPQ
ncbi:MAG: fatty acid desaturase [Gemmatimonadaceae bacterium]|nr:fatty acid desaturase [Gemmatimonadaceae bacterium]